MIALSRFLIVEDELLIAETIADLLKKEGCQEVTLAASVDEALNYLDAQPVDFVLTDIALGEGRSGIDLGNLISHHYKIPFIYITSHADKAMLEKAKHSRPNAYIVKPFKKEDVIAAVELGLYAASAPSDVQPQAGLIVREGRTMHRLQRQSILWIEADGNYSTIHLKDDRRRVIRQSLSEFEEQLPGDFIRIHKSYLVNGEHITQVNANSVVVAGAELPVGRSYQQNLSGIFRKPSP